MGRERSGKNVADAMALETRLREERRFEDADVLRRIRLCAIFRGEAARRLAADNAALRLALPPAGSDGEAAS